MKKRDCDYDLRQILFSTATAGFDVIIKNRSFIFSCLETHSYLQSTKSLNERKKLQNSRSGSGIQTLNKIGRPRFMNVKYISEIHAKYQKKISSLDEASIST